jgi:hypothetical protein|nr:MAG TPA: hypothetical protein [Caudoviricetes sp.]
MLNIFINSTTFGQAMGATFDMSVQGSLADKRLTDLSNCEVCQPVYERVIDANHVASLITAGQTQKVSNLGKAVEVENVRVNSLAMLVRELVFVSMLENRNDMIIAYVPGELLQELDSGRVKFYLAEDSTETTYYSDIELALWKEALPLIQNLYCRLVFKNINACKKNVSNTPVQADRVAINANMYTKLLTAFREMKAMKAGVQQQVASGGPAF